MDTKRLYVDFHVLQTVPPSCVNRDDTGSPKTAVYGGAVRARVSSQAWKHAMRVMFTEEMSDAVETGYRTKKGTDLVAKQIKALAPDADALKCRGTGAELYGGYRAGRTGTAHAAEHHAGGTGKGRRGEAVRE